MKNIKSCPFCGSNRFSIALINVEHTNHNGRIGTYIVRDAPPAVQIRCKDCGASMAHSFGVKDEVYRQIDIINEVTDSLIDKWNERHIDSETQLKAERLNRLDEWQKELDDREDEIDEKIQRYESLQNGVPQDKLLKLNQLGRWEEEVNERAIHNTEWENELDNRENELRHKEEEINEKLHKYQAIRDEMSILLQNIDNQNNEIYKRIDDLLKSSEND